MLRHVVSASLLQFGVETALGNPSRRAKNRPQSQLTGNQPPLYRPKCAENPFQLHLPKSHRGSWGVIGMDVRDQNVYDVLRLRAGGAQTGRQLGELRSEQIS